MFTINQRINSACISYFESITIFLEKYKAYFQKYCTFAHDIDKGVPCKRLRLYPRT